MTVDKSAAIGAITSRPYRGEEDLAAMQDLLMQARALTDDRSYPHVGELIWDFFMVACHLDPRAHIRLWHDGSGRLVAYSMLGEDPSWQCWTAPGSRWRGIEAEALAWAEQCLEELRRRDPPRWSGPLVSRSHRDDARRTGFLEQHGFGHRGTFDEVGLLRELDGPIARPSLPEGCRVRGLGEPADEIALRALAHREVWQPWTVGHVSSADYAAFMRLPGYRRELDLVAVPADGVIAAYANCWLDPVNRIGDFGPVGARPAYRRQGLTRAVLLEGLRRMRAAGMVRAHVSTGTSNTAARRLYESVGFRPAGLYLDYARPIL